MSNLNLLRQNLELVEADPSRHDQAAWRCSSGQCYAEWTPTLVGAEWVTDNEAKHHYDHVRITPELMAKYPKLGHVGVKPRWDFVQDYDLPPGVLVAHVSDFAGAVLDLTELDAAMLFRATNTLEDLQEMVEALERGESLLGYADDETDDARE